MAALPPPSRKEMDALTSQRDPTSDRAARDLGGIHTYTSLLNFSRLPSTMLGVSDRGNGAWMGSNCGTGMACCGVHHNALVLELERQLIYCLNSAF